jgi:hypothetical protein
MYGTSCFLSLQLATTVNTKLLDTNLDTNPDVDTTEVAAVVSRYMSGGSWHGRHPNS